LKLFVVLYIIMLRPYGLFRDWPAIQVWRRSCLMPTADEHSPQNAKSCGLHVNYSFSGFTSCSVLSRE